MGWLSRFFIGKSEDSEKKSRSLESIESSISLSFSRLRGDIEKVGLWIRYFAQEHLNNKEEHSLFRRELNSRSLEISELKNEQEKLISTLEKNAEILTELSRKVQELERELKEVREEAEKSGTDNGTCPGHVRDTLQNEKNFQKIEKVRKELKERSVEMPLASEDSLKTFRFTAGELEVLKVLHYTEKPISYSEIAKLVGRSEKSIRNIICELRKKGIEILDRQIGNREKGFYLAAKTKLLISGR
ncbi:MAG: hypothetical protein QXW00_01400 [Candidatus Woesearchaeota archaeon]